MTTTTMITNLMAMIIMAMVMVVDPDIKHKSYGNKWKGMLQKKLPTFLRL
jgi:hypothetical protein